MKITLLAAFSFVLLSCAHTRIPGQTMADPTLKKDIYSNIQIYEQARGGRKRLKVVDTRFIEREGDTIKELWLIDRKGILVRYLVGMTPTETGTNFSVRPIQ